MKTEEQALSLDELSDEVGQLLTKYALLGAQQDNRVSPVPDARTIRYYTTLGLIDRPRINGRQAIYGRRQVLQVLAIKALQAINLPLSEIQTRLYGRNDDELEALLASLADFWKQKEQDAQQKAETVRTVTWHEIEIEPGVKVLIQDNWQSDDISETSKKISAALEALRSRNKK